MGIWVLNLIVKTLCAEITGLLTQLAFSQSGFTIRRKKSTMPLMIGCQSK
jgi:hypothetical protein